MDTIKEKIKQKMKSKLRETEHFLCEKTIHRMEKKISNL